MPRTSIVRPAVTGISPYTFGSGYAHLFSDCCFSTTSDRLQIAFSDSISVLDSGKYRLMWFYVWGADSVDSSIEACMYVDDCILGMCTVMETADSGGFGVGGTNQRYTSSGLSVNPLSGGGHTITLRVKSTKRGKCVTIYAVNIEIWRVD